MRTIYYALTSLLRGEDSRLSWSKVVLAALVTGWFLGRDLSAALALVFLSATYGYRGLQLYLNRNNAEEGNDDDAE